ncbi:MAG: hypothetical protein JRF33_07690 [Deltaproteobacteria bacterium]|nr:hypothetical protein [Deltaproteobacteria bacterium]
MKNSSMLIPMMMALALFVLPTACSSDENPPDGGTIVDSGDEDGGECAVVCQKTEDCCDGEECIGGICTAGDTCPSGCNYECDKASNQHCNAASKKCEDGLDTDPCVTDCDCYTGENCISGTCQASGGDETHCTIDEECPEGEICREGSCRPETCVTREDCAGATCLICRNGQCTAPPAICQGDDDCCWGFSCNFGSCIPDSEGCRSDSDCPDPEFPLCGPDGLCIYECVQDIDCPMEGYVCVEHHCQSSGCTPQSCPAQTWCNTATGECLPGCDSNDDCISPETCNYTTHACGLTDCCGGICDPADQYCDQLTCQCVDLCGSNADCPPNFICDTGTGKCMCTAAACPTGTHCDDGSGSCVPDSAGTCETDDDCPAGYTCDLFSQTCRMYGGDTGAPCFTDEECDPDNEILCDGSLFCLGCMLVDEMFMPTFTCRRQCSMLMGGCNTDEECLYRHTGLIFLCIPTSLL